MGQIEAMDMLHSVRNAVNDLRPMRFSKLYITVNVVSQRALPLVHLDRNTFDIRPHVAVDVRPVWERGLNEILNNVQVDFSWPVVPVLDKFNSISLHLLARRIYAGASGPG